VQGFDLAAVHAETAKGAGIAYYGYAIFHGDCAESTVGLTDSAAYACFGINYEHIFTPLKADRISR
jgi:hypothetical protein